uniref:ATP synthase mitochondrial F1 complex assembly factor 1 n=1 Tax=Neogobius melanostomus TaxID=47308 RepID=A0A8C6SKR3_9GOBI
MAAGLMLVSSRFRGLLSVRVPATRALVPGPVQTRTFALSPGPDPDQTRNAELNQNPFFSKYREKIQALRRSDPREYEARMERRSELQQEKVGHSRQEEFIRATEKTQTLDSILNLELVQDKTGPEISQFMFSSVHVFLGSCFPQFLFALPRSDGYEFVLGQWSGLELHFTSLINIQSAPSQLVLVHYPELKHKGIVLMTAERDGYAMGVAEAQCLANQVQLFYGGRDAAFRLVEAFNHRPAEFKHMDMIAELEQSGVVMETGV